MSLTETKLFGCLGPKCVYIELILTLRVISDTRPPTFLLTESLPFRITGAFSILGDEPPSFLPSLTCLGLTADPVVSQHC